MHLAQITGLRQTSSIFTAPTTLTSTLASRILTFGIFIAGTIFFIKLLISGFSYLTSSGDPGKVQAASKNLINALIGLIIVIAAYFIAQIIQAVFGINSIV